MNTAHWHLLLNHVPVMGAIAGTLILLAGYIFKNDSSVKRTSLGVFIASALVAIPAYLTGEGAEEMVEQLPGVTESVIETHEETAKIFLIILEVVGVIALITMILDWMKKKMASYFYLLALFFGVGSIFYAKQVATSGGEVRHTEIRAINSISDTGVITNEQQGEEKGDD